MPQCIIPGAKGQVCSLESVLVFSLWVTTAEARAADPGVAAADRGPVCSRAPTGIDAVAWWDGSNPFLI
jgi:hypothetical protein